MRSEAAATKINMQIAFTFEIIRGTPRLYDNFYLVIETNLM